MRESCLDLVLGKSGLVIKPTCFGGLNMLFVVVVVVVIKQTHYN